jgi:hypothetical protein
MGNHPKGGRRAAALFTVALLSTAIAALQTATALADNLDEERKPVANGEAPGDVLDDAVPSQRLRASELDAVRRVNDRAALRRAMHDAELVKERRDAGEFDPIIRYRAPTNPYEARRRIQEEYGPDSILTRSAHTVAAIANGVEKGSAKPFSGMATVTESIVNSGGDLLGLDPIDVPRLKPRISGKRAGVYVSTRW